MAALDERCAGCGPALFYCGERVHRLEQLDCWCKEHVPCVSHVCFTHWRIPGSHWVKGSGNQQLSAVSAVLYHGMTMCNDTSGKLSK